MILIKDINLSFAAKSGKDQDSSATAGTIDISRHSELHQTGASVCFALKHHAIKKTENYTMY